MKCLSLKQLCFQWWFLYCYFISNFFWQIDFPTNFVAINFHCPSIIVMSCLDLKICLIVLLLKKIQSMLSSFSCFDLQQKAWVKLQWGESHLLSLQVCLKIFTNRICNAQLIKKKVLTQNQKIWDSVEQDLVCFLMCTKIYYSVKCHIQF